MIIHHGLGFDYSQGFHPGGTQTWDQYVQAVNDADHAKSIAPTLSPADYLLPGDSLSNWPSGTTAGDIFNWYAQHAAVVWQTPSGQRTTDLKTGDPNVNYIRTADFVMTAPNGKTFNQPNGTQVPDPYSVGAPAMSGTPAAIAYMQNWNAQPQVGAPGKGPLASDITPASAAASVSATPVSALTTVNDGVQVQSLAVPATAANLPAGSTVNDVAAASGLSPITTMTSQLSSTVSGWSTSTWLIVAAAAAGGLYFMSKKGAK